MLINIVQIYKKIHDKQSSKELDILDSGNDKDIVKYNNLKFYIIDSQIYKYMNLDSKEKIISSNKKDYLINNGKIFIKLENESLGKFEILICSLNLTDNHIIPEILYKYKSKKLMVDDIDFLTINDFAQLNNQRMPSNNGELINIKNNEKIGKIFELSSPNLLGQINKNDTINNNNLTTTNDNEENETKKNSEIIKSKLILNY